MARVFFDTRENIHHLDAAYVVLPSDSGKIFVLNAAAGAAITLPSVADMGKGWNCRIITGLAFATTDWIVTATAAIIAGGINELPAGTVGPYSAAATTITIGFDSEESIGDYIDLVCDGTKIWLSGQSNLDAGYALA
tara:strand:+ start:95 stop:505 length:411 start_codon:yes stop_codon:yes gene_type:complete